MPVHKGIKVAAVNRKARHDYFIEDTLECGIALTGTEVKSIRKGSINLKDGYAMVKNGQLQLIGVHISPYEQGNIFNRNPLRPKKLLMHKREIRRLYAEVKQQGLTLIPLSVYFLNGRAKLEVGLCKGKKNYDKRETIKQRDLERNMRSGGDY